MAAYSTVIDTRDAINSITAGNDDRLLVVIGLARECVDVDALQSLAQDLAILNRKLSSELVFVLQSDASLIQDPHGDGSYQINLGIRQAREVLLGINQLGLATALDFRDTITPQFFADLLSWANVSARSESLQELVSGLSMPVGLSAPATDVASIVRAIETSVGEHRFLGVSAEGVCGVVTSTGNPNVLAVVSLPSSPSEEEEEGEQADFDRLDAAMKAIHKQRPGTSVVLDLGTEPDAASLRRACAKLQARDDESSRLAGVQLHVWGAAGLDAALLHQLSAAVKSRRRSATPDQHGSSAKLPETSNLRVVDVRPLLPPACLVEELPRPDRIGAAVRTSRLEIADILSGASDRLMVLAGPAAVETPAAALEYGARLAALARDVSDDVLLVMKVDISTPVTPSTGPWPGLLYDPNRDGSYQINHGIREARRLLLQLSTLGLPTGLEFREPITPQFFADLLSWASVSAGSETLQELVSGLSMPVGLRAPRMDDGGGEDVTMVRGAVGAAGSARHFLGVTSHGLAGIVHSSGNSDTATLLDGGVGGASERAARVLAVCAEFPADHSVVANCAGAAIPGAGASDAEQLAMGAVLAEAIGAGRPAPSAVAVNSYLLAGHQAAEDVVGGAPTVHGLSTTEPCVDWLATEQLIRSLATAVRKRRALRAHNGGAAEPKGVKRPRS